MSSQWLFERFAWHEIRAEHQHVDLDLIVGFEDTIW